MKKQPDNLCKICGARTEKLFKKKVLRTYSVQYFQCPSCRFIQTEKPFWLDEAYASPINIEDTGIMQRNLLLALQLIPFLLTLRRDAKILDYGGGYGFFTRIMRDFGFDSYWEDPYCQNLTARGFESKKGQKFDLITGFELFEHVEDPHELVKELLSRGEYIIFSTQISDGVEDLNSWWYMGFSHGQHISIYSKESIRHLAGEHDAFAFSVGSNLHVISKKSLHLIQKVLLHRIFFILFPLVFLLRKSKTVSDHEYLKKKRS